MKEGIPVFYLYLHSKIRENFNGNYISTKELTTYLFQWKIPHMLRPVIIKEMCHMNLLKEENRFTIRLNKCNFNMNNINKIYNKFNIY